MNLDDLGINDIVLNDEEAAEQEARCIVRLKTCAYQSKRGIHLRKDLVFMKRLCGRGFNILEEDTSNVGADEVIARIVNLHECDNGLYSVEMCNIGTDWETGYVDDYDYELVPFTPPEKQNQP